MPVNRRLLLPLICAGLLGVACLLLLLPQSHASANGQLNYAHLTQMQKRLVSQTLASALGPASGQFAPTSAQGGGPDGAPNTGPTSYAKAVGSAGADNYFPAADGKCSSRLGNNIKVNQNCLNVSDPDLQGRAQANNETSIAQDPFAPNHIVASDNNYIRGDGTCGSHFSLDGGQTWSDTTTPNSFTRGFADFARQYWQASGDTSVAWDSRGNSYLSCQLFNRGTVASPNPDQSSAFVVLRSTVERLRGAPLDPEPRSVLQLPRALCDLVLRSHG